MSRRDNESDLFSRIYFRVSTFQPCNCWSHQYFSSWRCSFTKSSQLVSFFCARHYSSTNFCIYSHRINKISLALAAKGYNVTTISEHIGAVATPNLHCLHLDKMHETMKDDKDSVVFSDFTEHGMESPWKTINILSDTSDKFCKGTFLSAGWKQLLAYPDDFKVFYSAKLCFVYP